MATPHVAGGAALYLADHPDATPADVATALLGAATPDKVGEPGAGSPRQAPVRRRRLTRLALK